MLTSGKILGDNYVPNLAKNYDNLIWYERVFISYFDWLKYKEMISNGDDYFNKK